MGGKVHCTAARASRRQDRLGGQRPARNGYNMRRVRQSSSASASGCEGEMWGARLSCCANMQARELSDYWIRRWLPQ